MVNISIVAAATDQKLIVMDVVISLERINLEQKFKLPLKALCKPVVTHSSDLEKS